ncbi:NAD(P)-binding domain-containing protein [Ammoniphilus resinae]|uniref:3-hydroxyisobutyrate dehydrogenase-like beta-hydroxyacid dehydrogenase n=1 Tax=Ammoniphilus resinae TaxID=861532 RepID=A0ABS4GKR1_9BACL|nr:NAD(P)-dependent oxidoreductase [Ammoniphilus resinae]MBP1930841.1 3-hydroxyisobutyrate dehydrogenase-like beta-hydroxyacid dehydrogenase [Ammoniphilus resinae]
MRLGFIGYGEAAYEMSCGLKQEGLDNMIAYNHSNHALVQSRAKEAQVELLDSAKDVLERANVIIVSVPADKALEASETLMRHLKRGQLYIDVSASSPNVKKAIWGNIQSKDVLFVDAQMMGPLLLYKHKVPIVASGSGTDLLVHLMKVYGMNIKKVGEDPGDASAIKLIRSIYMKGISVLFIELLEAAQALKVEELVLSSIRETMESWDFEKVLNRLVTGACIHAQRRAVELEGSIGILKDLEIDCLMSEAVRDKLLSLSRYQLKDRFPGGAPKDWWEALIALQEVKRERNE